MRLSSVVIGDSQTVGLDHCGVFDALGTPTHGIVGRGILQTRRWILAHPSSVRGRDVVYLQVGGNDLGAGAAAMRERFLLLLQTVHSLAPNARVVLGTVPVRGEWIDAHHSNFETTLNSINQWILTSGSGPGQFTAFDVNALIADPRRPREQLDIFERSRPNVHLNRLGYTVIAETFARRFLLP